MRHWSESAIFWKSSTFLGFCVAILWAASPELWRSPLSLIQDDARHFVVWLRQMAEPNLFPNDPIAAYFQSLTPRLYKMLFVPAALLKVDVVTWQFLFVAPLACLLLVISVYGFVSRLIDNPTDAGFAGLFLCLAFARIVIDGLPRSFGPPMLIFALTAFLGNRRWVLVVSVFLGAVLYPAASAVACMTMICFLPFTLSDSRVIRREKIIHVAVAVLAALSGILIFFAGVSKTGPTVTLAEAKLLPIFWEGGRTNFFCENLLAQIFCTGRAGILPVCIFKDWTGAPILSLGVTIAVIVLGGRAYHRVSRHAPTEMRNDSLRLMTSLLAAGVILFISAYAVAFRAHVPGRYASLSIGVVYKMSIIVFLIALSREVPRFFSGRIPESSAVRWKTVLFIVAWCALVAHSSGKANPIKDREPEISRYIRQTPVDTMIAGIGSYIDSIPAFTNRSVFASLELLAPYKQEHYNHMAERMRALDALYRSSLGSEFVGLIEKNAIDFFVLAHDTVTSDKKWTRSFPFLCGILEHSVFSENRDAVEACTVVRGSRHDLVSAECMRSFALKLNKKDSLR